MDCYDYDFSLAGFGSTAQNAINDFYACVAEEQAMCEKEGKVMPKLEFDIQYDTTLQMQNGLHHFADSSREVCFA